MKVSKYFFSVGYSLLSLILLAYANSSIAVPLALHTTPSTKDINLLWTKQIGASSGQTMGADVSVDGSGNSYVTGSTNTVILGQTQNGKEDYFIAKYDSGGVLQWARQVGAANGQTSGSRISVDSAGNSYVVGTTNIGISGRPQNGKADYFVAKYNPSGTLQWANQVGTANGNGQTSGLGISVDSAGNSYVTGITDIGISGQPRIGVYDGFVAKYGSDGTLQWTRQFGANSEITSGASISVDRAGNSYVVGTITVGTPGKDEADYFIAKYSADGTLQWTRQVGANRNATMALGVSTDNLGNSYITGATTVGLSGQQQNGNEDYFIAKYSADGTLQWTRQVGAKGGMTVGYDISNDSGGNSYVTGFTTVGISGQPQNGTIDYFIAKYDSNGTLQSIKQVGATNNNFGGSTYGSGISVDGAGNSYVIGSTNIGVSGQKQQGEEDCFIAKYRSAQLVPVSRWGSR